MIFEVGIKLLKEYDDEGYKRAFSQVFTWFPKDVGFNNDLSASQPDFVEDSGVQDYRPFPVDEHVSGAVLYIDNPFSVALQNLARKWKGRGKDMEKATLQSAYNGAAFVFARSQALSFILKSDPTGYTEVTTFTMDGTNLNFYAYYTTPSGDSTLEYYQYPEESYNMKKYKEFKYGRRHLRNTQDHVFKEAYALRDQPKEH